MIKLIVTQQSPSSHIVFHCERCETSWYAYPAHQAALEGLTTDNAFRKLLAALHHACSPAQSDHEQGVGGREDQGPGVAQAARSDPAGQPG